ncbi:hypothetical protein RRF57_008102 [Xylaria bambusicola]|uniref:Uncharacterized protein n=1 Tax=Xylaria bambusicola TaxID=326684 RepID=A0AAN7UT17_9PEZI
MIDVLAEVERYKRLARILSVAVDAEGDSGRGPQRAPEGHNAEENGRHDPGILDLCGPSEPDKSDDSSDGDRDGHDESELGLVQTTVPPSHRFDDYITDSARNARAQNAADEWGDVDEAGL